MAIISDQLDKDALKSRLEKISIAYLNGAELQD